MLLNLKIIYLVNLSILKSNIKLFQLVVCSVCTQMWVLIEDSSLQVLIIHLSALMVYYLWIWFLLFRFSFHISFFFIIPSFLLVLISYVALVSTLFISATVHFMSFFSPFLNYSHRFFLISLYFLLLSWFFLPLI